MLGALPVSEDVAARSVRRRQVCAGGFEAASKATPRLFPAGGASAVRKRHRVAGGFLQLPSPLACPRSMPGRQQGVFPVPRRLGAAR
jgi:hypothetical protein